MGRVKAWLERGGNEPSVLPCPDPKVLCLQCWEMGLMLDVLWDF